MKTLNIALAAAVLLGLPGIALAQEKSAARMPEATQSKEIPFEDMTFSHSGYAWYGPLKPDDKTTPDIRVFDGYGKVQSGPHATIMKWPKGFKSDLHSHTGDYYVVVISGIMSNYRPGGEIKKLGAGSYWFQKGGEAHVTECYSEDCTAVLVQNVGFDAQMLAHK